MAPADDIKSEGMEFEESDDEYNQGGGNDDVLVIDNDNEIESKNEALKVLESFLN